MTPRSPVLDHVARDVRHSWRTTVRAPGFTVAALSLGLAVGVATSVYVTADWLLRRSPGGVVEPDRLVALSLTEAGRPEIDGRFGFILPQYEALRDLQDVFAGIAAYAKTTRLATTGERTEEIVHQFVTGSYFPMLGVRPAMGRLIGPDDDVDGAQALAVISHSFWQSRFGGDPEVIGASMRFGPDPVRVIGVLPSHYEDYSLDWIGPTQVWLPMRSAQNLSGMAGMLTLRTSFFPIMGRLQPGVGLARAREVAPGWVASLPEAQSAFFQPNSIAITRERDRRIARREAASTFLGALLTVAILVLMAASANVVNFQLGQTLRRRRELAIRAALGASRRRLAGQIATESALLGAVTAVVAVAAGVASARLLAPLPGLYLGIAEYSDPITTAGAIDLRLAGYALAAAFVCSVSLGLASLIGTFHDPLSTIRRPSATSGWGRWRPSPRGAVVVLQVVLCAVLTLSATLLARSASRAAAADPELAEPTTLLFALLAPVGVDRPELAPMMQAVRQELEQHPAVRSVSFSFLTAWSGILATARRADGVGAAVDAGAEAAGPGFFEVGETEVVAGRTFEESETAEGEAVVNELLASQLWPGEDPIGRTFLFADDELTVRGVVARSRCVELLGPPVGCVWRSWDPALTRTIWVRTHGPADTFTPTLHSTVERVAPRLAVTREQTLEQLIARKTRPARLAAAGATALAAFSVLLLAVGIGSVFLTLVRDTRRELAVRIALGATKRRLAARVGTHGLALLAVGIPAGLVAGRPVADLLAGQLYDVVPTDPVSYAVATGVVLIVGVGAVTTGALSAARTAPSEVLARE